MVNDNTRIIQEIIDEVEDTSDEPITADVGYIEDEFEEELHYEEEEYLDYPSEDPQELDFNNDYVTTYDDYFFPEDQQEDWY